MPQTNSPKVMPDLGALSLQDVSYYVRFFNRIAEMMVIARAIDPDCDPVAVISPGLSPCIELTGLQSPSEQVMVQDYKSIGEYLAEYMPKPQVADIDLPISGYDREIDKLRDTQPASDAEDDGPLPAEPDHPSSGGIGSPAADASAVASSPRNADAPAAGGVPPSPPQAPAPAAGPQKPARWTEEEDAKVIYLVAGAVANDFTMKNAIDWAAASVGRPRPSTEFRIYGKLKPRIDARVAELRAEKKTSPAPEQAAPEPAGPKPAGQMDAGDGGPAAADVAAPQADGQAGAGDTETPAPANPAGVDGVFAPEPTDDLTPMGEALAHLRWMAAQTVAAKPFSTARQDYDILHFTGLRWPAQEIAQEVGLTDGQVAARVRALTKMRALPVPTVMAALAQLHPELADGADDDAA